MNRRDAQTIVEQGLSYEELQALLIGEFDGTRSVTIPEFTKAEVQFLCRGCIDTKGGRVLPGSHDALIAMLALMEFGPHSTN